MTVKLGPMKARFLPYFIDSTLIDDYLINSQKFFDELPNVCPFCGWIGDNPRHHGYTEDWTCPVLWLAESVELLKSGKYVSEEELNENIH